MDTIRKVKDETLSSMFVDCENTSSVFHLSREPYFCFQNRKLDFISLLICLTLMEIRKLIKKNSWW